MKPGGMPMPALRKFMLLDGMIVIGSIALGLAPIRWIAPSQPTWLFLKSAASLFVWDVNYFDQVFSELWPLGSLMVLSLTLGLLVLRLREPRPKWRRLVRQPGLVAALAVMLAWLIAGAFLFVSVFCWSANSFAMNKLGMLDASDAMNWFLTSDAIGAVLAGFAVLVAWATQLLVGRWRAESTWLDRSGRILGVVWVALGLVVAYTLRDL